MELKNVNTNGDNVVSSNLTNVNFFLRKAMKIEFKNEEDVLFFLKDTMIAHKKIFLILLTSQINII
jgi:hypothetical protein